jgi:HAD superfamily hydrolase (TIGR01490 family)
VGRGGAFFDLDKTLIEGSSALHFGRAAYRAGVMSRGRLLSDVWANVLFRLKGSTDEGTEALRNRILEGIAGHRVVDLARLGPEVLAGILPRVYPEVLREAWDHQDAGRPAYIVTAASQEMAEMLAHVLILDGGIGMRSEIRDGVYTGRADGPFTYREGKAQAVRERAEREGLDLSESYAYSDSESDLPMLRAVGHPVAVNPDAELRRIALEENWPVMHIDKLGRRLRIAAALGGVGALAASAGYAAARLRPRRRRIPLTG